MSFLFGGGSSSAPPPAPPPEVKPPPEDLAERQKKDAQRALGAGITDSGNEVDTLGLPRTKRAGAARSILG